MQNESYRHFRILRYENVQLYKAFNFYFITRLRIHWFNAKCACRCWLFFCDFGKSKYDFFCIFYKYPIQICKFFFFYSKTVKIAKKNRKHSLPIHKLHTYRIGLGESWYFSLKKSLQANWLELRPYWTRFLSFSWFSWKDIAIQSNTNRGNVFTVIFEIIFSHVKKIVEIQL